MKILYSIFRTFNLFMAIIPSIALYRATVQEEYKWGLLAIEGKGRSSDYIWLLLFTLIGWASFSFERWYKRKWYYILPSILYLISLSVVLYGFISTKQMKFKGDAWGISIDMGMLLLFFLIMLFCLYIVWLIKDLKKFRSQTLELDKMAKIGIAIILIQSFFILMLFAQGEGGVHSNYDRIAVVLTVIQGLTIAYINDKSRIKEQHKSYPKK